MLPPDFSMRLRPTWPASGYFPTLYFENEGGSFAMSYVTDRGFDNGLRFVDADEIPVYLIDASHLGRIETAFVPNGERCVFVNAGSLDRLFEDFFMMGKHVLGQHNSFDKALVLAVVLLHELGHLHFEDDGSYGPPAAFALEEIDRPSRAIANKEVRADRFASEMVNAAWASQQMKSPLDGPYGRAGIASNIFRAIATGANSHDFTVDPQGVFDGVRKPYVFRQSGYSHLNLYLRLLVLAQQINPSEERLNELRWLELALKGEHR